jgi:ATP-dependent Clp protease adaptor protein ClpS
MGQEENHKENQESTATKAKSKVKRPPMYKVILLNDDYTTMEFVVHILQKFFQKSLEEATRIMLHVHVKGMGICGFYPHEIAETKVAQVTDYARKEEYPLQCKMEEA